MADAARPRRAAFHSRRHTFATLAFAEGRNVVQVQELLGHADASFTLRTYVGSMDGDVGGPVNLDGARPPRRREVA